MRVQRVVQRQVQVQIQKEYERKRGVRAIDQMAVERETSGMGQKVQWGEERLVVRVEWS